MPDRPTKEFWARVYPNVLRGYLKKGIPRGEAESRARKTTAEIWYRRVSGNVKQKYERKRRKRERGHQHHRKSSPLDHFWR